MKYDSNELKFCESNASDSRFTQTEDLKTPIQFFRYFVNEEIISHIQRQTAIYDMQKRPENSLKITKREIEQFIGIVMYMSLVRLNRSRNYWFRFEKVVL